MRRSTSLAVLSISIISFLGAACSGPATTVGPASSVPPPTETSPGGSQAPASSAAATPIPLPTSIPTQAGNGGPAPSEVSATTANPASSTPVAGAMGTFSTGQFSQAGSLTGFSCGSPTFCMYQAMRWDGTAWKSVSSTDVGSVDAINCHATADCEAIADDRFATWNGSGWKLGENFQRIGGAQGGVRISDMSCPTDGFCAAVDGTYGYAFEWDGSTWSKPVTVDPVVADSTAQVNAGKSLNLIVMSVACASPTFCPALDTAGNATTFNGRTWSKLAQVATPSGERKPPLACPTPTYCTASVGGGVTYWNGTAWSTPTSIAPAGFPPSRAGFAGVSCASDTFCMTVGSASQSLVGDWGVIRGTGYTGGAQPVGIQDPSLVSCPSAAFCMVVGPYGWATWRP